MASAVPLISITNPTPPRPIEPPNSNSYRLLYRGALSLPDSHLLLDGLTFAARLESPSKHNHLLQNPLALALESMRGRPSLRLLGVVKLDDDNIWLDDSGGIELDIHPNATLTRIYFENTFCLVPFASTSKPTSISPDTSDIGLKVAIGDIDGPDTTEIVICADCAPNYDQDNRRLRLIVARIAPRPVSRTNVLRLPRPDDPTPRKPPLFFGGGKTGMRMKLTRMASDGSVLGGRELKGAPSLSGATPKRQEVGLADLGSGFRLGEEKQGQKGLFKVPQVPPINGKAKGKEISRPVTGEMDVFGGSDIGIDIYNRKPPSVGKGKRKRDAHDDGIGETNLAIETERANKNAIKLCVLNNLSNVKDPTSVRIDKTHPDYKEIFGWVYRGVGFALRARMKTRPIDMSIAERLVKTHINMYVGGHGGMDQPEGTSSSFESH
ncbi:hypothetical protein BDZ94DRAFT_1309646 [Collybia nuda]|uniref:Sld7 C-terminal domain-containing protein n=1 Tax=Collybia nuda TaxID=64659 RepID=A0A9P5Y516_9AGAR|nr:hypothetical protein BDZ94DRAFT_1309646 [Collybia nuda]